jgi:hypothetical protein
MGAIAALLCANAHALDLAPSVSIGTTGFGAHLSFPLAQKLDLRIGCNLPGAMCAALQSDIAAETANLRDKGDSFQVYPVLRIGAVYRF